MSHGLSGYPRQNFFPAAFLVLRFSPGDLTPARPLRAVLLIPFFFSFPAMSFSLKLDSLPITLRGCLPLISLSSVPYLVAAVSLDADLLGVCLDAVNVRVGSGLAIRFLAAISFRRHRPPPSPATARTGSPATRKAITFPRVFAPWIRSAPRRSPLDPTAVGLSEPVEGALVLQPLAFLPETFFTPVCDLSLLSHRAISISCFCPAVFRMSA